MLDWTERLTVAVALVFVASLGAAVVLDSAAGWLVWGVAMVALAGAALVWVNRSQPPPE